ncbi:MAG: response regulator [Anaerovoracaceae bacterium]
MIRCETVAEAQKAAAGGGADIMICDINLPDGSGLDFIRSIREGQQDKRPYIICLTVLDTQFGRVLG